MSGAEFGRALHFLATIQSEVELALEEGLTEIATREMATVSEYNREQAFLEQYNLVRGEDCCYDRPGTGFAYASWFHPRRVNELICRLLPIMSEIRSGTVMLDLGAGTGASAWAIALARLGAAATDASVPSELRVLAVDSSPSMLEAGEWLWLSLLSRIPGIGDGIVMERAVHPWLDPPPAVQGSWLIAGHVFDSSDNNDEIRFQFRRMLMRVQPERVLLDAPVTKLPQLSSAVRGGEEAGWPSHTVPAVIPKPVWRGPLERIGDIRREHFGSVGVGSAKLRRDPEWDSGPQLVRADLQRGTTSSGRLFAVGPVGLALDDDQDRLAEPSDRFEVLIGAAGSGKSVILVERIARTVGVALRSGEIPRMLVTTRNIAMIELLRQWLVDRLLRDIPTVRCSAMSQGNYELAWDTRIGRATIRLVNWDKVPTQLFHKPSTGWDDLAAVRARRDGWIRSGSSLGSVGSKHVDDLDWLCAELRRVIHGKRLRSESAYFETPRSGRRTPLQRTSRRDVWEILMSEGPISFTYLWMSLIDDDESVFEAGSSIKDATGRPLFTGAFIDEVQDLSIVDIQFVAAMLPDAKRLYCVGDAGQAMLLGQTFDVPRIVRGRRWLPRTLGHSYRMTRRLAEAVQPLAESMLARSPQGFVGVPVGSRSGVVGTRPIIVLSDGTELVAIEEILTTYTLKFDSERALITVAEGRMGSAEVGAARRAVPTADVRAESMAKIKGLERTAVIWSTGSRWHLDESAEEFVHTVLTRASSLVIILLEPDQTDLDILEALHRLRRDRLLFWTREAERIWDRCCR